MATKKKTAEKNSKENKPLRLTSLPQNILKMGGQVEEDKNIYISQTAYKAIHNFTKGKLENESGGMLMGYTLEGAGKTNIIIDGFIEGKHSEATPTTLKFTHETWEYVHAEADKKYPEYKIIGWIHTHPSFGIFLSEYDKFIQQNFFNEENQIAYVVDPIQKTEGFYFWINGRIERCNGFYIYDETGTQILIESEQPDEAKQTTVGQMVTREKPWKDYLLVVTCLLSAILLFITISLRGQLSDLENDTNKIIFEQETAEKYIASLLTELNSVKQKLNETQKDIEDIMASIKRNEDEKYHCKILFVNDDGTVFLEEEYPFGAQITLPATTPVKEPDAEFTYVFAGWGLVPDHALENAVYTATFTAVPREYTIKFVDLEGNSISEAKYHYGNTVDVPTYTATKETEEPKAYRYVLTWDKEIAVVTGDVTYTAVFEKQYIEYTVTFERDDGSVIEKKIYHYNDTITVADPTKNSTETHTYAFAGWNKEFAPVTEDTVYIANFDGTPITNPDEGDGGEQS